MVELEVVDAGHCHGCGGRHQVRVSVVREETPHPRSVQETPEVELGVFIRCPVTGHPAWAVIRVADGEAARARLLHVSLADQDARVPSSSEHRLPRGAMSSAYGNRSRVTEMLRRALGCPLYT